MGPSFIRFNLWGHILFPYRIWHYVMQVMTTGQRVSFEYHGNNYIFTVNQAVVEGREKSNDVERGMVSGDTYFIFEAANSSGIKVNLNIYIVSLLFVVFVKHFFIIFYSC